MLRPLIIANPDVSGGGAFRRSFEVLRRAKRHGIEPVIVVPMDYIRNRHYVDVLKNEYKVHILKAHGPLHALRGALYPFKTYYALFNYAYQLIKSTGLRDELREVDLVVSHHEEPQYELIAYSLAHRSKVPWTALIQLHHCVPTFSLQRSSLKRLYTIINNYVANYLNWRVLNTTTMLVVGLSVVYEFKERGFPLNKYIVLKPPVGINLDVVRESKPLSEAYDAVYFARLIPEKGVFDVLKVWHFVRKVIPRAKLCVMGRFENKIHERKFFEVIRDLNLSENVVYKGFVSEHLKYSVLKSSKVMVYPSLLDAFPTVVVEALACGLPVITYNVPFTLNFETHAIIRVRTKDYRSMAEAIIELLHDEELCKKLSNEAITYAANFTWDNVVKAEKEAYLKILNEYTNY